jgi:hypothetical protein
MEWPERGTKNAAAALAPKPRCRRNMAKPIVKQYLAHVVLGACIDPENPSGPVSAAVQRIGKDMAIGGDAGAVGKREIVAVDADVELGHHGFSITAA